MKPGRELDALVAEKVMNIPAWAVKMGLENRTRPRNDSAHVKEIRFVLPEYSTDIAAAWVIVEKIGSLSPSHPGFAFDGGDEQPFCLKWERGAWSCGWYPWHLGGNSECEARAETAPHAICLAALGALGDRA